MGARRRARLRRRRRGLLRERDGRRGRVHRRAAWVYINRIDDYVMPTPSSAPTISSAPTTTAVPTPVPTSYAPSPKPTTAASTAGARRRLQTLNDTSSYYNESAPASTPTIARRTARRRSAAAAVPQLHRGRGRLARRDVQQHERDDRAVARADDDADDGHDGHGAHQLHALPDAVRRVGPRGRHRRLRRGRLRRARERRDTARARLGRARSTRTSQYATRNATSTRRRRRLAALGDVLAAQERDARAAVDAQVLLRQLGLEDPHHARARPSPRPASAQRARRRCPG